MLYNQYNSVFSKLSNSKVLITGSTGMITIYLSFFLVFLHEKFNFEVYLQGRNINKTIKIFNEVLSEKIHILDFDFEKNNFPNIDFDYIIHAASPASSSYFVEKPVDTILPNAIGTYNLLNFFKDKHIKKFIVLSSNSIYGEGGIDKDIITENEYGIVDPLGIRASYIESKRFAEQVGIAFYRQYNVPISIIRICHTYGPTFDIENDKRIIPRVVKSILNNEDILIYKDEDSKIQYTYVSDIVSAILIVLLNGAYGEAYNAGGDDIVFLKDAISWMIKADNRIVSKIIEKKVDNNYKFKKGNGINYIKLSNYKIKTLGWKQLFSCKIGFEHMIKKYIDFNSIKYYSNEF